MSAGRPASAHMARKIRKKGSGKKKDHTACSLATRRGSLGSIQGDRYHRTSFPLVMDLPDSSDDSYLFNVPMDSSPAPLRNSHIFFPFQLLPDVCKLKIWSLLKQCDLGRCMLVCVEWHNHIKKPHVWHSIQFSELPYSCLPHERTGPIHMDPICHHCFRKRVYSFSRFLTSVRPIVNRFQFCFDISHPTDQFLSVVEQFISTAKLSNLKHANINWKDSPSRQPLRDSSEGLRDYIHRFRRRQRMFVIFFDNFTSLTQHLTTLVVPFDWSERSVSSLCRLTTLETLILERYGIYSHVSQVLIDAVLGHLVNLRKLLLEVWIPTRIKAFSIESVSLTYLDLSQCRGFYLGSVRTPSLIQLKMVRQAWNNTIIWQQMAPVSCLLTVLASGAPKVVNINGQVLNSDWANHPPEQLHSLMYTICCCTTHKNGSSIGGIM